VKVVELQLPPLRARGSEDVERLARHFLSTAARIHRIKPVPSLSEAALARLLGWRWPGNVRELENCIESAVVLCDGVIQPEHLPMPSVETTAPSTPALVDQEPFGDETLAAVERRHVLAVLERHGGNRSSAARALGIGRNTLGRKLKDWGLGDGE
jgi:Nif-specific regulatory protein